MPKPSPSRIGSRFGKLVVLEKAEAKPRNGNHKYRCKCDCGNEHYAWWAHLKSGATQSCGCLRTGKAPHKGKTGE